MPTWRQGPTSASMPAGIGPNRVAAQVAAGRWQLCGTAVVRHNTALTRGEQWQAALINCGPRAVLTSFTAAEAWGLRGWSRPEVHVLAPAGTTRPRLPGLVLHRTGDWGRAEVSVAERLHRLAPALVIPISTPSGAARVGGPSPPKSTVRCT